MDTQYVESNGIRLHVTTDGPSDGDPVLLIHGFPETSYEWRKQIPALVEAGYRVIVPDTRGFGQSDKPPGPYSRALLADDMVGVLDHFDVEQAAVVGHDWGRDHRLQAGDRPPAPRVAHRADGHAVHRLAAAGDSWLLVQGGAAAGGVLCAVPR